LSVADLEITDRDSSTGATRRRRVVVEVVVGNEGRRVTRTRGKGKHSREFR
jgi:hypothetical protein